MIEQLIVKWLILNTEYGRRVITHVKPEYFKSQPERELFTLIKEHFLKYNAFPAVEAIALGLTNTGRISDDEFKLAGQLLSQSDSWKFDVEMQFALDETENFCRSAAILHALMESLDIIKNKDSKKPVSSVPSLLQDALNVGFTRTVGHDFLEEWLARHKEYTEKLSRLPFDLEYFDKVTRGGLPPGSLSIALAPTGVGKSIFLCHCASSYLNRGKNVLYISGELKESQIGQRIDANLLDVPVSDLETITLDSFQKRHEHLRQKTKGKLIIQWYPPGMAGIDNFDQLLMELKAKKNFVPDAVCIDYITCFKSVRFKPDAGSFKYYKAVAEEFSGFAGIHNIPVLTATQAKRDAFGSTDINMEDTGESIGLPQVADFMFAIQSSEDMAKMGHWLIKQLKNRWRDENLDRRFMVGIDKPKMKLYDLDSQPVVQNSAVPVKTQTPAPQKGPKDFTGFH